MRRTAIGFLSCAGGLGMALWSATPALADGSLTINPGTARPGQSIGITTSDCNIKDGTATLTSGAFNRVSTDVSDGDANTSVTLRKNVRVGTTYKVTMVCLTSHVRMYGQITITSGSKPHHGRCWRDDGGWHGNCHHQGPETGGGGSLGGDGRATAVGLGLLGTGAAVGGFSWLRRVRT
ncbi:MAG: hypothetical protein ABIS86_18380 [Streptosporangiaceae bacterium]